MTHTGCFVFQLIVFTVVQLLLTAASYQPITVLLCMNTNISAPFKLFRSFDPYPFYL